MPADLTPAGITITAANISDDSHATAEATYTALASIMSSFPDLMDQGVTGSGASFYGDIAKTYLSLPSTPPGMTTSLIFWSFNMTVDKFSSILTPLKESIVDNLGDAAGTLSISLSNVSVTNCTAFFHSINASPSVAGSGGVSSSRPLGRSHLSEPPLEALTSHIKKIAATETDGARSMMTIGLQGGLGPMNVPLERRGAVNPIWREVYAHVLVGGADVDFDTYTPGQALARAGDWLEANKKAVWRKWAPDTGAYMNEANLFNGEWKHDFYGSSYDRLVGIKRMYDPNGVIFVRSGVDSEFRNHDMDTGLLHQTT